MFGNESPGTLLSISGADRRGAWTHAAFVPDRSARMAPS